MNSLLRPFSQYFAFNSGIAQFASIGETFQFGLWIHLGFARKYDIALRRLSAGIRCGLYFVETCDLGFPTSDRLALYIDVLVVYAHLP